MDNNQHQQQQQQQQPQVQVEEAIPVAQAVVDQGPMIPHIPQVNDTVVAELTATLTFSAKVMGYVFGFILIANLVMVFVYDLEGQTILYIGLAVVVYMATPCLMYHGAKDKNRCMIFTASFFSTMGSIGGVLVLIDLVQLVGYFAKSRESGSILLPLILGMLLVLFITCLCCTTCYHGWMLGNKLGKTVVVFVQPNMQVVPVQVQPKLTV